MNQRPTDEEYREISKWRRYGTKLALGEYFHAQLPTEEAIHQEMEGMPEDEAQDLTFRRMGSLAKYFRRANLNPVVWAWGAGSKDSDNPDKNPGIGVVSDTVMAIAQLVAQKPKQWAVVNGSCPWGVMSIFDRAWIAAQGVIFHIPLKFFLRNGEAEHEPDCRNATQGCTAPKRVGMGSRTETFGCSGYVEGVILGPGGSGSMFEFSWFLESIKFRSSLLTAFSGWHDDLLPPLAMLDYWMDPDGTNPQRARYFFEAERANLETRVLAGVMRQGAMAKIVIVRVGQGEDIIDPDRIGPAVRYFATSEEAAEYIVRAFEIKSVDLN